METQRGAGRGDRPQYGHRGTAPLWTWGCGGSGGGTAPLGGTAPFRTRECGPTGDRNGGTAPFWAQGWGHSPIGGHSPIKDMGMGAQPHWGAKGWEHSPIKDIGMGAQPHWGHRDGGTAPLGGTAPQKPPLVPQAPDGGHRAAPPPSPLTCTSTSTQRPSITKPPPIPQPPPLPPNPPGRPHCGVPYRARARAAPRGPTYVLIMALRAALRSRSANLSMRRAATGGAER